MEQNILFVNQCLEYKFFKWKVEENKPNAEKIPGGGEIPWKIYILGTARTMVLILDGNSLIGAHAGRKLFY